MNEEDILKKIRKRKSYNMWTELLDIMRESEVTTLNWVYNELDRRRSFRSNTNAWYAKVSLDLLIKDRVSKEHNFPHLKECLEVERELKRRKEERGRQKQERLASEFEQSFKTHGI